MTIWQDLVADHGFQAGYAALNYLHSQPSDDRMVFSLGIRLCCPRLIPLRDVFQHTADPRFDYGKQLWLHSGIIGELIEPSI